jgi:hypothetical protein
MAIARSRGKLKGRQPKLTARQQVELIQMRHRRRHHRRADGGLLCRPGFPLRILTRPASTTSPRRRLANRSLGDHQRNISPNQVR